MILTFCCAPVRRCQCSTRHCTRHDASVLVVRNETLNDGLSCGMNHCGDGFLTVGIQLSRDHKVRGDQRLTADS